MVKVDCRPLSCTYVQVAHKYAEVYNNQLREDNENLRGACKSIREFYEKLLDEANKNIYFIIPKTMKFDKENLEKLELKLNEWKALCIAYAEKWKVDEKEIIEMQLKSREINDMFRRHKLLK